MCLIVKEANKTKKPVECYKVMLEAFDIDSGEYAMTVTPFQYVRVNKKILNGEWLFKAKTESSLIKWDCIDNQIGFTLKNKTEKNNFRIKYVVSQGFIHVYMNKSEMTDDISWYFKNIDGNKEHIGNKWYILKVAVYRCEIPEGTLYCRGHFESKLAGCARQIRFVKKLDLFLF